MWQTFNKNSKKTTAALRSSLKLQINGHWKHVIHAFASNGAALGVVIVFSQGFDGVLALLSGDMLGIIGVSFIDFVADKNIDAFFLINLYIVEPFTDGVFKGTRLRHIEHDEKHIGAWVHETA